MQKKLQKNACMSGKKVIYITSGQKGILYNLLFYNPIRDYLKKANVTVKDVLHSSGCLEKITSQYSQTMYELHLRQLMHF